MREITISLTEEQERYLKLFASKHYSGSDDNLCTSQSLHLVETQTERVVDPDHEAPDKVNYYVPDHGEDYETMQELIEAYWENQSEECPIEIVDYDTAYDADEFIGADGEEWVITDEDDYLSAYGIPEDFYHKTNICFGYRTAAVFFILDEARKYKEYQGHNLSNPRTYTIGAGYANHGEYHHFWELLFGIGEILNKAEEAK